MNLEEQQIEILLESMESKIDLILEGMSRLNMRVERLEDDMIIVKEAVVPVNPIKIVVAEHETRLNRRENQIAV